MKIAPEAGMEKLGKLLDQIVGTQESLLRLETEKTEILLHGGVAELDAMMAKEQPLIMSASALEKRRIELLSDMGAEGETLRAFAERFDEDGAYGLKERYNRLSELLAQLKKVNAYNQVILKARIQTIEKLTAIEATSVSAGTYEKTGKLK